MNLAICSGCFADEIFRGKADIYTILDLALHYKFVALEVRRDLLTNPAVDIKKLREITAKNNLSLIYSVLNWPLDRNLALMRENCNAVISGIQEAKLLGSRILKIGFGPIESLRELTGAHFEMWAQVVKCAEEAEIVLCMENSDKVSGGDAAVIHDFIAKYDSPYLRVTYDCGNFVSSGRDPLAALTTLADYIGYIHLKDVRAGETGSTFLGNGEIDFAAIFRVLAQNRYPGFFCFEFSMNTARLNEIEKSLEYLLAIKSS